MELNVDFNLPPAYWILGIVVLVMIAVYVLRLWLGNSLVPTSRPAALAM